MEPPPPQHAPRVRAARPCRQGHVAVNSILRDWIKGQVTAVECGILSFEAVFMPYMLTNDGRPLLERVEEMVAARELEKALANAHKLDANEKRPGSMQFQPDSDRAGYGTSRRREAPLLF